MTDGTARQTVTRRLVLGLLGAALLPGERVRAAAGVSDADRTALVMGNSEFGLDLDARLRATDGNLFFSPYSISSALAMAWAGARGATADEMARALRLSLEARRLHPASAGLIRDLTGAKAKRSGELYVANALWSQTGYPFVADFQQVAKTGYGAALEEVDFGRSPESARRTINAWVEKQTHDKIRDLLQDGAVQCDTALVLTNAIYFKGTWTHSFPARDTQPAEFSLGAKGTVGNVPLMHRGNTSYRYLEGDTFQALDLPYENEQSMIVFLPRTVEGLADFEKTLTVARLTDWVAQMTPHKVDVALPRFKVTATFALKQPLIDLGMTRAFSRDRADFSGMVQGRPVFLDAVAHKAYVDVNEKGTVAAAAFGLVFGTTSAPRVFRADHPFFFLIRDNRTGTILFAGRLANPQGT